MRKSHIIVSVVIPDVAKIPKSASSDKDGGCPCHQEHNCHVAHQKSANTSRDGGP